MKHKICLPKYVSQYKDRHGKQRLRFRKTGYRTYNFQAKYGTEDFQAELDQCLASIVPQRIVHRTKTEPRSIDHLVSKYFQSGDFIRNAKPQTLDKNKAIINRFRKKHGHRSTEKVSFEAIDKIITQAKNKKPDGTGGQFAAQKLRKELKRLFRYAVKIKWLQSNPVDFVDPIKTKTKGFHTWTEEEIKMYQDFWPLGTTQRLAMELMLWTAKRMGDAIKIGPEHIRDGCLISTDAKTAKDSWLPIAPPLRAAIDKMENKTPVFILTSFGKPYSDKSFSQRFSKWCVDAGLANCTAHGLRKAMSRRMAEARATNSEIKSITQHVGDAEVALYVREANQKMLAAKTMNILSDIYK